MEAIAASGVWPRQLYLLRSQRNWGIGDFTDLAGLVALARERGADVVGLSPLHAMFPDQPEQASPYSPSDRRPLNVLYIDVERVPEFTASAEAKAGSPTLTSSSSLPAAC